jgi:hypothetical protein
VRALEKSLGEARRPEPDGAARRERAARSPRATAGDAATRPRSRLPAVAVALACVAVAGVLYAVLARGGTQSPENTPPGTTAAVSPSLLEAIPERNRPCERGTGADGFWMRDIGAQEQANCSLAVDQTTPSLVGGSLQYGRFASPAAARAGLGDSESFARKTDNSVPCDGATRQRCAVAAGATHGWSVSSTRRRPR